MHNESIWMRHKMPEIDKYKIDDDGECSGCHAIVEKDISVRTYHTRVDCPFKYDEIHEKLDKIIEILKLQVATK